MIPFSVLAGVGILLLIIISLYCDRLEKRFKKEDIPFGMKQRK